MGQAVLCIYRYSIRELLVQPQVVGYLCEIAKRRFGIHLLTFEKERLSAAQPLAWEAGNLVATA